MLSKSEQETIVNTSPPQAEVMIWSNVASDIRALRKKAPKVREVASGT